MQLEVLLERLEAGTVWMLAPATYARSCVAPRRAGKDAKLTRPWWGTWLGLMFFS